MAKKLEFYQGRRQKRNFWLIPFIILLGLITLMFVLFYGVQKYAVISDDGVSVIFPGTQSDSGSKTGHAESSEHTFDTVVPEIVFEAPDYSRITATAGKRVWALRAKFLDASQISLETLQDAAASLVDGNALMLEMKPRSGQLVWNSQTDMAKNYGTSTDTEFSNSLPSLLPTLKEREDGKKIYLVAQISCFIDDLLATRSDQFALRTESGFNYSNEDGSWLDPYNSDVRNYIIGLAKELYTMGFDEVVLSDVRHPVGAEVQNAEGEYVKASFTYSREMSTEPNPITAICGFAVYASDQLKERKGLLSIYTDTPRSLVRDDEDNGQNAVLFMKIFDRVYYRTDRYTYTYNLQDMEGSVPYGKIQDRFVPVVINLIPHDNSSWVYIEQLE
ncbi:MAG: putative glycoside hydrolase [Oscillospiraceae bacterium]|nr:putative glycoside hydrolase [Oscillospiraceae bacterium]